MMLLVYPYQTCSDTIPKLLMSQERVSNVAYNVVNGLCTPIRDINAPVYITVGDGGNVEGLANK